MMFFSVIIPYAISLYVKQLINFISLLSSILCPYFIIIAPSLMGLKLSKELKFGKLKKAFICIYMFGVTGILGVSIFYNIVAFIEGKEVVG